MNSDRSDFISVADRTRVNRDLKQPGRVCGRRREKTSEVWVENVVQSGKNKCLSKLPSRLVAEVGRLHRMASFKEIRELLL